MSYEKFKPEVWAATIERDLEREHVFATDCYRKYEGDVQKEGDTVRILGVNKPTITTTGDGKPVRLSDPESVPSTHISMPIMKQSYFHFLVDNIDKAQGVSGIMEAQMKEATEALANEQDKYIADFANDGQAKLLDDAVVTVTADNVFNIFDKAVTKLYENDVNPNTKKSIVVPPWFLQLMKDAQIKIDTDNSDQIKNGKVTVYNNTIVRMSNNVWTDGTAFKIMLRTERALAFVSQISKVKAYEPEKAFADAVKGISLYDAKIVRPKEMIVLNVKQ